MVRFYLSGLLCLPQLVTWLKAAYCCLFVYSSPAWRAVSLPSVGPARGTLGSGTWGPQEGLSTEWAGHQDPWILVLVLIWSQRYPGHIASPFSLHFPHL